MNTSVIIPFSKGDPERLEGLHIMLECIKKQTFRDFELIFVEMTRDGTSTYLPYTPDKFILLPYDGIMNKSWVCNVGVRAAEGERLIMLDADSQFDETYFQRLLDFHESSKKPFFVGWEFCRMLAGRDEPTERLIVAKDMKAAAHAWFVTKEFYWLIGGMNEKYFGYGAEDQDFWERAKHRLRDWPIFMKGEIQHTYHHYHPKDSAYPLNPRRVDLKVETMNNLELEIEKLRKRHDLLGRDKPCGNCNAAI